MIKIKIEQLLWDEFNIEHIKKHNVTRVEVEEAVQNIKTHREGYSGRIFLIGRTRKRILAILVALEENKQYYPITARDADKKERRLLYENENK